MSLGAAEGRRNEALSVIPGNLDSHDSSAQAKDVHVVVFDTLADRIMVVAQTGANPFNLITLAPKKLIRTRRASEGSASEPSLARRVSMCKDAKLSCRGNIGRHESPDAAARLR